MRTYTLTSLRLFRADDETRTEIVLLDRESSESLETFAIHALSCLASLKTDGATLRVSEGFLAEWRADHKAP